MCVYKSALKKLAICLLQILGFFKQLDNEQFLLSYFLRSCCLLQTNEDKWLTNEVKIPKGSIISTLLDILIYDFGVGS